jgi:hypothetical protein
MPELSALELLQALLQDLAAAIPKLAVGVAALFLAFLLIRLVHRVVKVLVDASGLEERLRSMIPGGTRLPVALVISLALDAMILVSAASLVVRLFVPEYTAAYREYLGVLARAGSVAVLSLVAIIVVDALAKSMGLEEKTERFFTMLTSLFIVTLAVDLAALSPEVKQALVIGLAVGIGLLIGAFALWAFFGDYIERVIEGRAGGGR